MTRRARIVTLVGRVAPVAAIVAGVVACFSMYLFQGRFLIEDDTYTQEYPILTRLFADRSLFTMPRWSPEIFLGYPLLGSTEAHVFTPLNVLFLWLSPESGLPVRFVAFFLLSSGLMYWLLRTLGCGRSGALFGGLFWGTGYHSLFTLIEIRALATMVWFPGVLAAYTRFLRGGGVGFGILTALGVGACMLGGHMQHSYAFAGFAAVYTVLLDHCEGRALGLRWVLRRSATGLLIGALGVGIGAITLLPTVELLGESVRAEMAPQARLPDSLAPKHLPTLLLPWLATQSEVLLDYCGIGVLPAVLALVSVTRRAPLQRGIGLVGASFLGVSLGQSAGVTQWILLHLPHYDFREPHRIGLMWTLSVAMLAGFGLHGLVDQRTEERRSPWPAVLVLVAGLLGAAVLRDGFAHAATLEQTPRIVVEMVASVAGLGLVAGLLARPELGSRPSSRAAVVALLLTLQVAPGAFARNQYPVAPAPGRSFDDPLPARYVHVIDNRRPRPAAVPPVLAPSVRARVLERDAFGPVRTAVVSPLVGDGALNFALMGTHQEPFGYLSLAPRRVMRLARKAYDVGVENALLPEFPIYRDPRLLSMLNVRYLVVFDSQEPSATGIGEGFIRRFGDGRVVVFENPRYLPRCFFAATAEWVPDEKRALDRVLSPAFDPTRSVLIEGVAGVRASGVTGPGETGILAARVRSYRDEDVVCDVDAPDPGWAVLLDRHAPGWQARVNGRPAEILRADYLFRAVAVEAGRSQVEFSYRSRSLALGSQISLTSLGIAGLGLATLGAVRLRRGKRHLHSSRTRAGVE